MDDIAVYDPTDMPTQEDLDRAFGDGKGNSGTASSSTSSSRNSSKSSGAGNGSNRKKASRSARPSAASTSDSIPVPVERAPSTSPDTSRSNSHTTLGETPKRTDDDQQEGQNKQGHMLIEDMLVEMERDPAPAPQVPAEAQPAPPPPKQVKLPSPIRSSSPTDNDGAREASPIPTVAVRPSSKKQDKPAKEVISDSEDEDDEDRASDHSDAFPVQSSVHGSAAKKKNNKTGNKRISSVDNDDDNDSFDYEGLLDIPPPLNKANKADTRKRDSDKENDSKTDDDDAGQAKGRATRKALVKPNLVPPPARTRNGGARARDASVGPGGTQGVRASSRRTSSDDNPVAIGKTFKDDKSFLRAAAAGVMMENEHLASINVIAADEENAEGQAWLEVVCINMKDREVDGAKTINLGCSVTIEACFDKRGKKTIWTIKKSNLLHCNECLDFDAKLMRKNDAHFPEKWEEQYNEYKYKQEVDKQEQERRSASTANDDSGYQMQDNRSDTGDGIEGEDDDEEQDQFADNGAMEIDSESEKENTKPKIAAKKRSRSRSGTAKPAATASKKRKTQATSRTQAQTRSSRSGRLTSIPLSINPRTKILDLGLSNTVEETLLDANIFEIADLRRKEVEDDVTDYILRLRSYSRRSKFEFTQKQGVDRTSEDFDEFSDLVAGGRKLQRYVVQCYGPARRD